MVLLLNTKTGYVSPQYPVVFDNALYTVDHIRKGIVPGNWKNKVKDHSELATQETFTLEK